MKITKALLLTALTWAISFIVAAPFVILQLVFKFDFGNQESYFQYRLISGIAIILLSNFIMFFFVCKIKININRGIEKIKNINWSMVLILLIIMLGLKLIIHPIYNFKSLLYTLDIMKTSLNHHSLPVYKKAQIYDAISFLMIAPILEELLFRRYFFIELLKKNSLIVSVLVSSFCFMMIHLPNWPNLVPCFILGVLCCLIYFRTHNLLYSILFHWMYNFYWFIGTYYVESYEDWLDGLHFNPIYWFLFITGIGIVWYGIKRIENVELDDRWIQEEI